MPTIKPKKTMWRHKPSDYEMDAAMWCMKNEIKISPLAFDKVQTYWYIEIELNGKINKSPKKYDINEISKKIYEFYVFYYEKLNNEKAKERS